MTGLPSEQTAVKPFIQHLIHCVNLGAMNACHSKRSFTLSPDAIKQCNWSF